RCHCRHNPAADVFLQHLVESGDFRGRIEQLRPDLFTLDIVNAAKMVECGWNRRESVRLLQDRADCNSHPLTPAAPPDEAGPRGLPLCETRPRTRQSTPGGRV